jgi:hypothetical protein
MDKFKSRRFGLAVFFSLASTVALYFDKMSDSNYVMVVGLIMGIYGATSHFGKKGNSDDT